MISELRSWADEHRHLAFPAVAFGLTIVLLMPLAVLGQRTYVAVDMLDQGAPYEAEIENPAVVSPIQTDQVEWLPWTVSFFDDLRDGEWQEWNHLIGAGMPTGILPLKGNTSPVNLGFLVLPDWYAVNVAVILLLLISQWGTYLLVRRLGAAVIPSTLAAIAYTFVGTNIVFYHRITAVALVPGLLWAVHRLDERVSARRVAVVALGVAWVWAEGFPSGFVHIAYIVAAWSAYLVARRWHTGNHDTRTALIRLGAMMAAGLLGLAISAVTLVPFIDEVSSRGVLDERQFDSSSHLAPTSLFGLFDLSATGDPLRGPWFNAGNPVEVLSHVGMIVTLAVAATLLAAGRGRLALPRPASATWGFWCGVMVIGVLFTYVGTPLLGLAYELPGLSNSPLFRIRFIIGLGAAVVAGLGLDAYWAAARSPDRSVERTAPSRIVSLLTLVFLLGVTLWYLADFIDLVEVAEQRRRVARGFGLSGFTALLAAGLAALVARRRAAVATGGAALALLLFLQLAWPLRDFTPDIDRDAFYPVTSAHEQVIDLLDGRYRFAATGLQDFYSNSAMIIGYPDLRGLGLHSEEFKNLVRVAAPVAFDRDAFKVIASRDEWDVTSAALDDLAVGIFALDPEELPFGEVTAGDAIAGWLPIGDLAATPQRIESPGGVSGVQIPLRVSGDCTGSVLELTVAHEGEILDEETRFPQRLLTGQWPRFEEWAAIAVTAQSVAAGDVYELVLEPDIVPACAIEVGVAASDPARVAIRHHREAADATVRLVATENAALYERTRAHELVHATAEWTGVGTQEEALQLVAGRSLTGLDTTVVVGAVDPPALGATPSTVERFSFTPDGVDAEIRGSHTNLVVVAQNMSPGWTARIDGEPAEIHLVDGVLAGVLVPAGEHVLTMRYAPDTFRWGARVSIAALLVALLLLWSPWRSSRWPAVAGPKRRATPSGS